MSCRFCGEDDTLDFLELWPEEGAFILDACCEEMQDERQRVFFEEALELPLHQRIKLLKPLRELFRDYGIPFRMTFTVHDGRVHWDEGLEVRPLESKERVRRWIGRHHRHNRPPVAWLAAWGAFNGGKLVAVATLARPVSRKLAERGILEVTRVCSRTDVPTELTFNASSQLYAVAAAEAKRRGAPKVVTYTLLEGETGHSLKAAGWKDEHITRAESWDRPSRPRPNSPPAQQKVRWSKPLRPEPQTALAGIL